MKTLPRLNIRLTAFLTALLLAVPLAAFAKDGQGGRGRMHRQHNPEERLGRLTEHLDLSAEQQEQLRPVLEEQAASFRAIRDRKQAGESWEALREEMQAQRESTVQQIEAVLDEQQLEEYQQLREHRRERVHQKREKRREHRGERDGDADAELAEDLAEDPA